VEGIKGEGTSTNAAATSLLGKEGKKFLKLK
jgi:hypothetical protein